VADESPAEVATRAALEFAARSGAPQHDVALVMGSGWLSAADALGTTQVEVAFTELPGFTAPEAGMAGQPLDHREVLAAGRVAAATMGRLLAAVLPRMVIPVAMTPR
jgi:purine-nucleoside phosphorylase